MTFAEYEAYMKRTDPSIIVMFDRGDDTCLIVKRLLYHFTMLVSDIGDMTGYTTRYCYQTAELAIIAATEWLVTGATEPTGWHRHPDSGRRRPGGDPAKEYINP